MTQQVHSGYVCVLSPKELKIRIEANVQTFIAAPFSMAKDGNNPDVHQLMGKYNVLYPDNGMVLSHKKEWSSETQDNMGEP